MKTRTIAGIGVLVLAAVGIGAGLRPAAEPKCVGISVAPVRWSEGRDAGGAGGGEYHRFVVIRAFEDGSIESAEVTREELRSGELARKWSR